jgi:hypothetical protein
MFWQHNSPNIVQALLEFCFRLERTFIALCWPSRAYLNSLYLTIFENQQVTSCRWRYSAKYFIPAIYEVSTDSQLTGSSYRYSIYSLCHVGASNIRAFVSCMLAAVLRAVLALAWTLEGTFTLLTDNSSHTTFDSSVAQMVA